MKKFTNVNILQEMKRLNKNIVIAFVLIVVGIALGVWSCFIIQEAYNTAKPLNDIIMSEEDQEYKVATLNIQRKPFQFAIQDGNPNSYYIVMDDTYMYIAYMSEYDYTLLNKEDIKENPVQVKGITKLISQEIKELALEAYNEGLEEEEQLTMADFDSYFGNIYLDITQEDSEIAIFQTIGSMLFLLLGTILLIVFVVQKIHFNTNIKKMEEDFIEKLDEEMNSSNAFYYKNTHLYLTENYIINFSGMFKVISYKDVIWMYSMVYRTNGIKTKQSIKVMTKNGKTYEIAAIDVLTKAKKEIYDEIWNTIISKNNNIILGYTKEASQEAKALIEKN